MSGQSGERAASVDTTRANVAPTSPTSEPCSCSEGRRLSVQYTADLVNWDALSSLACKIRNVDSAHWGEQLSGGYNVVRFLHLHDAQKTVLVARVPLRSEDDMSAGYDSAISKRIASEVATMEYVETYTAIPVPHIFHHCAHADGDIRSPYILMSKVAGVPLFSVWKDMDDVKRHAILSQVIDILLELWSHRFPAKGALFKKSDESEAKGKDAWYIESDSVFADPSNTDSTDRLPTTSYSHAADYWLAYANAKLLDISHSNFGSDSKIYEYAHFWFMRSLIPALFDPAIDAEGCPLLPWDFNSQNIMVDIDSTINHPHPRITSVINWEFLDRTTFHLSPMRERNMQDRATFDKLIREAEGSSSHPTVAGVELSGLISGSRTIYLFQQVMECEIMFYTVLYPDLFAQVFGDADDDAPFKFSTEYCLALIEKGILRHDRERFDKEHGVWLEARSILGEDEVSRNMSTAEFSAVISKNRGKFEEEGSVLAWLASAGSTASTQT